MEFDSPDEPGSGGEKMNEMLIKALDYVRQQLGTPISINSGYRSEQHNKDVGGVPKSQHRIGNAADVSIDSQEMGDSIEYWFKDYLGPELVGIGRYVTRDNGAGFIHLDVRGHKARWSNQAYKDYTKE